ncbi:HNH endonuclease [Selenomonas montiformis]
MVGGQATNDERNLRSLCVNCHEKIHRRKKKDG